MFDSPMTPKQLRASLLVEQVSDLLREAIVSMQLRPGQRLVERELVEWAGVARTTIREALRQLAAEGLVTMIPQRGAFVAVPSAREAEEIYQIRAALEGMSGQQFVERASPAQRTALREAYEAMRAELDSPTPQLLKAKNCFYEVLFDGAQNETVKNVLTGLHARVSVLRATSMGQPGRPRSAVEEILAIVEAVEADDAAAAAQACEAHVLSACRIALDALAASPVKRPPD